MINNDRLSCWSAIPGWSGITSQGTFIQWLCACFMGRLGIEEQYPLEDVAMVPCLYGEGAREVPVVDVQTKGIRLLQERPMAWGELEETLMEGFSLKSEESREKWRRITERQMAELIHKGVMAVRDNK